MDIMIDIESWATVPQAVVRAIGIVAFSRWSGAILNQHLIDATASVDNQIEHGRVIDPTTVGWWQNQHALSGILDTYKNRITVSTTDQLQNAVLHLLHQYTWDENLRKFHHDARLWSRGGFDMQVLRTLGEMPWFYWQERDVRTLDELQVKEQSNHPHDPMSDCLAQIKQVHNVFAAAGRVASSEKEPHHAPTSS